MLNNTNIQNINLYIPLNWFASKAATGNTKTTNPLPKYRGIKIYDGEIVNQGSIIYIGNQIKPGRNTFYGKTYCIHASKKGIVSYQTYYQKNKKQVKIHVKEIQINLIADLHNKTNGIQ